MLLAGLNNSAFFSCLSPVRIIKVNILVGASEVEPNLLGELTDKPLEEGADLPFEEEVHGPRILVGSTPASEEKGSFWGSLLLFKLKQSSRSQDRNEGQQLPPKEVPQPHQ